AILPPSSLAPLALFPAPTRAHRRCRPVTAAATELRAPGEHSHWLRCIPPRRLRRPRTRVGMEMHQTAGLVVVFPVGCRTTSSSIRRPQGIPEPTDLPYSPDMLEPRSQTPPSTTTPTTPEVPTTTCCPLMT
uniref:Uncharacterized protein n=1 Tax=Triticum urartu TaxID=4572 RepID=A0A8R7QA87_TRIUA